MFGYYALLKLSKYIGLGCWIVLICLMLNRCTADAMPLAAPIEIPQEAQGGQ